MAILDTTNAAAAYGLRKLRTAHSGSAIRVRRSADNSESDIGFSGSDLNSTALTNFCKGKSVTANGGAKISTAQYKFGDSSGAFDGDGDYLDIASSSDFDFGTDTDFTIEMWAKGAAQSRPYPALIANKDANYVGEACVLTFDHQDASAHKFSLMHQGSYNETPVVVSSTTVDDNTWRHLAVTRSGDTIRLYVGGTLESTRVNSNVDLDFSFNGTRIAGNGWDGVNANFNGYIDDLHVSKGIARYTGSTYTVPTAAQTADQYTVLLLHMDGANNSTVFTDDSGSTSCDGFIAKWYDQTGNGYDLVQATTGNQPRIVSAGTIDVLNTKPAMLWDGSNDRLTYSGSTFNNPNQIHTVAKFSSTNALRYLFDSNNSGARNAGYNLATGKTAFNAGTEVDTNQTTGTDYLARTFVFDGSNSKFWHNGTQVGSTHNTNTNNMTGINVGCDNAGGNVLSGYISELMLFDTVTSDADRRLVETDESDYFGLSAANLLRTKALTAGVTIVGTIKKATGKVIAAAATVLGSFVASFISGATTYYKTLVAGVTTSAIIMRTTKKVALAAVVAGAQLSKQTLKSISTGVLAEALINYSRTFVKQLITLAVASGAIPKNTSKRVLAVVATSANISRRITKSVVAIAKSGATHTKNIGKAILTGVLGAGGVSTSLLQIYLAHTIRRFTAAEKTRRFEVRK